MRMRRYQALPCIPLDGFTSSDDYLKSETFRKNCRKRFNCTGHNDPNRICNASIYLKCKLCINCECPHYKHPPYIMLVIK